MVHVEVDAVPVATEDIRELVADTDAVSLQELASGERSRRARLIARLPAEADVRIGDDDGSQKTTICARVSPRTRLAIGQPAELAVDTTRLYFFDPKTRASL